ncbi:NUDIX domain-containing protein [Campylobacter avium]|uniref:NUDIX domain-containing protein n=1 Tax=Campylobacter avium TaxID=522485 RepID=UPI00235439F5|nr:NUDIX domain-containing protein [Campylobacter avium]
MDIQSLKQEEFTSSVYIKTKRFTFLRNGKKHSWDFVESLDSVSVLLYHKSLCSFVFVKQFRIPLWDYQLRNNMQLPKDELGKSVELCSGLVDKNLSIEDIAKEECLEEIGYLPKSVEKISEFYSGFGSGASKQTMFFAEIDEDDKKGLGGGLDDEEIEVVFVKVKDFEDFAKTVAHSSSFEFAYLWFMKHKSKLYNINS